jgi:hypothetical protein
MYPKVLHKGDIHNRKTKRVEDEAEHALAKKAGWSETPASWGEHDAEHGPIDPQGDQDSDGDDAGDVKRPVPEKAAKKAAKKK